MKKEILKLAEKLSSKEILELSKHMQILYKRKLLQENSQKAKEFKIGDIVVFNVKRQTHTGIVLKIVLSKVVLITTDKQKGKVSPIALTKCSNPSKVAIALREEVLASFKGLIK